MIDRKLRIAVFGGREISTELYKLTRELGKLLAKEEWLVFCGGGSGVMEAISRGMSEAGGTTVGILKGRDFNEANPWVTIPIVTDMGISRNALLAYNCDVAVAVDGNYGTLSEIAYALQLGKPVIGLHTWDISNIIVADNPVDIIIKIKENL
ncbi:MAG: TIGR00725 family protein [Candidatus Marinimicrobia bacterium]|nr:TIGR00725 family protein [Candidatus Neomarinimicrobiota bacterium]